jgi:hypothetical protein
MIGAPLLAAGFSAGIDIGGLALGLSFFVASAMYVVCGVCVWLLRVPERRLHE